MRRLPQSRDVKVMMTPTEFNTDDSDLDRAIARRLSKLRTTPVDTTCLEQFIRSQIPEPTAAKPIRLHWLRSSRAVAAGLLLAGILTALLITSSTGPAIASPVALAQIHEQAVSGHASLIPVNSMSEAAAALEEEWRSSPKLPHISEGEVMSCCIRGMGRKKLAVVSLMTSDGVPVTIAIADAAEIGIPSATSIQRNNATYYAESSSNINMVMFKRNGRWICLMGELATSRLVELSEEIR